MTTAATLLPPLSSSPPTSGAAPPGPAAPPGGPPFQSALTEHRARTANAEGQQEQSLQAPGAAALAPPHSSHQGAFSAHASTSAPAPADAGPASADAGPASADAAAAPDAAAAGTTAVAVLSPAPLHVPALPPRAPCSMLAGRAASAPEPPAGLVVGPGAEDPAQIVSSSHTGTATGAPSGSDAQASATAQLPAGSAGAAGGTAPGGARGSIAPPRGGASSGQDLVAERDAHSGASRGAPAPQSGEPSGSGAGRHTTTARLTSPAGTPAGPATHARAQGGAANASGGAGSRPAAPASGTRAPGGVQERPDGQELAEGQERPAGHAAVQPPLAAGQLRASAAGAGAGAGQAAGGAEALADPLAFNEAAATSSPSELAPAPGPGVPMQEMIDSIRATIEIAARQGIAQARIALEPEDLGHISIRLSQTSAGLLARVSADTAAAAQALTGARGELHQSLSSLGVSLLRLDIGSSAGSDARGREGRFGEGAGTSRSSADPSGLQEGEGAEAGGAPVGAGAPAGLHSGGLVDVLA